MDYYDELEDYEDPSLDYESIPMEERTNELMDQDVLHADCPSRVMSNGYCIDCGIEVLYD